MALNRGLVAEQSKDVSHAILDALDRIVGLLQQQQDAPEMAADYLAQNWAMLRLLVANTLPAALDSTRQVPVTPVETLLVENESQVLMRVDITNLDPAQPLWVSGQGVTITNGQVILPNQTSPFVIPIHESLFGICAVAIINIVVGECHDIFRLVDMLGPTIWMRPQTS